MEPTAGRANFLVPSPVDRVLACSDFAVLDLPDKTGFQFTTGSPLEKQSQRFQVLTLYFGFGFITMKLFYFKTAIHCETMQRSFRYPSGTFIYGLFHVKTHTRLQTCSDSERCEILTSLVWLSVLNNWDVLKIGFSELVHGMLCLVKPQLKKKCPRSVWLMFPLSYENAISEYSQFRTTSF